MLWTYLRAHVPAEHAEALVALLEAQEGFEAVECRVLGDGVTEVLARTLWTGEADPRVEAVEAAANALLAQLLPLGQRAAVWCEVLEGLEQVTPWRFDEPQPVAFAERLGQRVVVKDPAQDWHAEPRDVIIELLPSVSFGNGAHATTRLCCRALERHVRPGDRVADVGSGTGLLALVAAGLGASVVLAVDTEPAAVASARENVALNGQAARVLVFEHEGLRYLEDLSLDVCVSNVLSFVIREIAPDVVRNLRPGGRWLQSGLHADAVIEQHAEMQALGLECIDVDVEDDWACVVYLRPEVATAPAPPGRKEA